MHIPLTFEMNNGDTIKQDELVDDWFADFSRADAGRIPALRALGIDAGLCEVVNIGLATDGRWVAWWSERHPERGTFDECFGSITSARTDEHLEEWHDLCLRMPDKDYYVEITRKAAFEIVTQLWLPEVFAAML